MTDDNEKYINEITRLTAWAGLPGGLREKIARLLLSIGDLRNIEQDQTWIREGEHTENNGYVLLRGTAAVIRENNPVAECEAPALLGEMMQFNPRELRLATITAKTRCTVLRFTWDNFWQAARQQLQEQDHATVQKTIEQFAWSRFMDWD